MKIVKGQTIADAGGAGMIVVNTAAQGETTDAEVDVLPASHVGYVAGEAIKSYIRSTPYPVARMTFDGTFIGEDTALWVPSFSSRGPSRASPGILKPDIIGPGCSILAAWPVNLDYESYAMATFNTLFGSSLACPHLAGIMALLKSAHPDWSPAAIKSAIMTTADQVSLGGQPIVDDGGIPSDVFAKGVGHVNPSKANYPGLIFDIQPDDYIPYLYGLGYTSIEVEWIVRRRVASPKAISEGQLNYPSFAVTLAACDEKKYARTVTNVGEAYSSYNIEIDFDSDSDSDPSGVTVEVRPKELKFTELKQKLTYQVLSLGTAR